MCSLLCLTNCIANTQWMMSHWFIHLTKLLFLTITPELIFQEMAEVTSVMFIKLHFLHHNIITTYSQGKENCSYLHSMNNSLWFMWTGSFVILGMGTIWALPLGTSHLKLTTEYFKLQYVINMYTQNFNEASLSYIKLQIIFETYYIFKVQVIC